MRNYESLYILHPEVVADEQTALVEKFQGVLTQQGGEIHKLDNWGLRKLAYPIKKLERGCYIQTLFRADPSIIAEYERRLRLDENILRFITIRVEGEFPAEPATEETPDDEASAETETADDE